MQYDRVVESVFGATLSQRDLLPPADTQDTYDNQGIRQNVQRLHAERWDAVANRTAQYLVLNPDGLLGCAGMPLASCVEAKLPDWGQGLFRRPLTNDEVQKYLGYYQSVAQTSPEQAATSVLAAMLMSPNFLFMVERGIPLGNGLVQLNGYELASRLSFMILGAPPDQQLLAAAAAGELNTPEGLERHARSMLDGAGDVVLDFHKQWLGLSGKHQLEVPDGVPMSVLDSAEEELRWFIQDWFSSADTATLSGLFLSPRSWLDADLANVYGAPPPAVPGMAELPTDQRAGVLTRLMFLGTHPTPSGRGAFVMERVLCSPIPVPPNAMFDALPVVAGETRRERFSRHSGVPCAAACHGKLDPMGFAFEHFDEYGIWRDEDNGKAVDAATSITVGFADVDGPVDGATQMSQRLAESATARSCVSSHWFQYANARRAAPQDQCSMEHVRNAFEVSGGNVRELLVALTQVDAFRFVRKEGL
jgi:hypothetical protein